MARISLSAIAEHMRDLDICMMVTKGTRGGFNSRPMSNNRDVDFKGDAWFFTYEKTQKVKDLERSADISLNFEGKKDMYISISGKAKLIRNKKAFQDHWVKSLDQWFRNGPDTPGIVLIHVKGKKLRYWQREKEGEISLQSGK